MGGEEKIKMHTLAWCVCVCMLVGGTHCVKAHHASATAAWHHIVTFQCRTPAISLGQGQSDQIRGYMVLQARTACMVSAQWFLLRQSGTQVPEEDKGILSEDIIVQL